MGIGLNVQFAVEFDEQRDVYRHTPVDLSEERFVFLNTLFSLSESCLYAQLVDFYDRRLVGDLGPLGFRRTTELGRLLPCLPALVSAGILEPGLQLALDLGRDQFDGGWLGHGDYPFGPGRLTPGTLAAPVAARGAVSQPALPQRHRSPISPTWPRATGSRPRSGSPSSSRTKVRGSKPSAQIW